MQQLIYTSAPRLLESGKTGFGTVSCSRGIPKPLISYLERISTFDREAGVSSLDYYSCFRMGAARFHVFTRVSDAGADYTGRTNHLAQHFIVEDGTPEFALLAASTPAGVLAELEQLFLPSWNGQVGYLEGEIPPPAPQTGIYYAWQTCTGRADNARWLAASYYLDSCCLNADVSARTALELLHDGLLQRDDHGWGMGLSTAVVSNLGASAFPITFLGGEQRAVGVRAGAGAHLLSPSPALQPPKESDIPAVASPAIAAPIPVPVPIPEVAPPPPDVLSAPLPLPEVVPDFNGHGETHGSRRGRSRGKGESQTIMLVGVLAVAVLGFIAWNMTGDKEAPQPEPPAPVEQTPPSAKPKKKPQDVPALPTIGGGPDIRRDTPPRQPTEQPAETQQNEQTTPPHDNADKGTCGTPPPQPPDLSDTPAGGAKTPAARPAEETGTAPESTDTSKKTSPVFNVPEFGVTGIRIVIIMGKDEKEFWGYEELLKFFDSKDIKVSDVSISILFDRVEEHVQNCLGEQEHVVFDPVKEKEDPALAGEITEAIKEYVLSKKKLQRKQADYEKKRGDVPTGTTPEKKERYKIVAECLSLEDVAPKFSEAKEMLKKENDKKSVKIIEEKLEPMYIEIRETVKKSREARKQLETSLKKLFAKKETMKQAFSVSGPDKDGCIEVKTEIIETP